MEFKRSKGGVLVPDSTLLKQHKAKKKFRLDKFINILLVIIQIGTVGVLWLTYKNTVIPARQKELLAEEVAKLELEKKNIIAQVNSGNEQLLLLNNRTRIQQAALAKLKSDKESLELQVNNLADKARLADRATSVARLRLKEASKSLTIGQIEIFSSTATYAIAYPILKQPVVDLSHGDDAEKYWHNYQAISEEVVEELKKVRSPFFPDKMPEDFSGVYAEKSKSFTCKPDFKDISSRYELSIKAVNSKSELDAIKYENDYLAKQPIRKNVKYVVSAKNHEQIVDNFKVGNEMSADLSRDHELIRDQGNCDQKYLQMGQAILDDYTKRLREDASTY